MGNQHIQLTSAELSYLWSTYLADSMSVCMFRYFLQHLEDEDVRPLLTRALESFQQHAETIQGIFSEEGIHIPQGFTDEDVNLEAQRLFSDIFYLNYASAMTKGGLKTYARVLQHTFRDDIRSFFSNCLTSTLDLDTEVTRLLLDKGLAVRHPTIPYPKRQEFIHKSSFILEGLKRREVLTGTEITNLHMNIQTNHLGTCLATAFAQATQSNQVRKYVSRGKDIALKHVKVFSSYLEMNSLPVPRSFDQEVTESTEAPFSDKLMMFHFSLMVYSGIGNYGVSISEAQRSDLVLDYSRLTGEVLKFSEDGMNIMIENEWLEQPPLAANRDDLVNE